MFNDPDQYQEIRDAVRQICKQFPDEYFRKIDEERVYWGGVRNTRFHTTLRNL